ncbi:low-specificity L-threonine aldolase [Aliikangiella sp. IMCC44653]
MSKVIDFRSDTVTQPSDAMRQAMASAEVGDDVYGDDPSVNRLQNKVAELTGHEAALLVPSGTQSNLIALLTHCGRGDEYIVGQDYHTYLYEAGGAACLGGIQPQPIEVSDDGTLNLNKVAQRIKPDDVHFAKTKLLALENTHSGQVIEQHYLKQAIELAHQNRMLAHLDGARVFNAAVAQAVDVATITASFDSVSVCCSKGLGAPIGSLLCGSKAFIEQAKRWRKMLGGGMRQAGVIAAAIDYAIEHNFERLSQDHNHAQLLGSLLAPIEELAVEAVHTNMLYINFASEQVAKDVESQLKAQGIIFSGAKRTRLVTHLGIDEKAVYRFVASLKQALVKS